MDEMKQELEDGGERPKGEKWIQRKNGARDDDRGSNVRFTGPKRDLGAL